jgi:hypothetical protein
MTGLSNRLCEPYAAAPSPAPSTLPVSRKSMGNHSRPVRLRFLLHSLVVAAAIRPARSSSASEIG